MTTSSSTSVNPPAAHDRPRPRRFRIACSLPPPPGLSRSELRRSELPPLRTLNEHMLTQGKNLAPSCQQNPRSRHPKTRRRVQEGVSRTRRRLDKGPITASAARLPRPALLVQIEDVVLRVEAHHAVPRARRSRCPRRTLLYDVQ